MHNYIEKLENIVPVLLESLRPENLDLSKWNSLIINRRKPYTYRAFIQIEGFRVCLHKFEACSEEDAFPHPHPWPGAFLMLEGEYIQNIGYSPDLQSDPVFMYKEVVRPYTIYQIDNKQTWHTVQPTKTTYTVMLNGEPWDEQHAKTRTTKGKDLDRMEEKDLVVHFQKFCSLLSDYRISHH